MRPSPKYLPLSILICFATGIYGQNKKNYTILGKISDHRGVSLPGVTVKIQNTNKGTVTNGRGEFTFQVIKRGAYTLEISSIGFKKIVRSIDISSAETRLNLRLQEEVSELDEVVVTAESEAQKLELSAKAVQVIETREIKLKSADLGEVMAKTEGVNVQRGGGLGSGVRFSLNGLSGDQIRFFYNDIPLQFTPYAFGIANVPVNMIDRVEIYKGVVPIQFGADALGGAVNLASSEFYEGITGSASYQVGSFNTHRVTANVNYSNTRAGLFAAVGGFFDYTDNNYKIDARREIENEDGSPTGQSTVTEARRFHDAYDAHGVNLIVGLRDKSWADQISLEGYYGDYFNEVQNSQSPGLVDLPLLGFDNIVFGNPFGDVVFTSNSKGINLFYSKTLSDKLTLDIKTGYNYTARVSVDTSRYRYNWLGERVVKPSGSNEFTPGEFGLANHLVTINESLFARQQLDYIVSDDHVLKLSIAPTYAYRTGDELLIEGDDDRALDDRRLFDLVTGIEYTSHWLNKRLENTAFVKNYRQNIRIEAFDPSVSETRIDKRSVSNYGAGNGLKFSWSPRLFTKLSYEFAYRLPRQDEIFGDGQLIVQNPELRPESSHNVNLQWRYSNKKQSLTLWQFQGNFFLRRIDDLIFLLVDQNDFGSFQNVWSATSQGVELSGRWEGFIKGLAISANTTYQRYFNTSETGPFVDFEGDRIPNTPYFFGNGAAEYKREDVFKKQDRLSVFWNARYVHAFFVSWESAGVQQFKDQVPDQTSHNVGLTHRMPIKKIQNALTLEVQNLFNAKIFDLFGVQRPGRAFYIKSTIQF